MTDYERALAFVLLWEGGRVDDKLDKGGRTNKGITQRTYDGWKDDHKEPHADVWDIEDDEVMGIYRDTYWWPAAKAEWPLNLVLFDSSVLFGPGRAQEWLAAVSWYEASPVAQAWAVLCLRRERHRANIAKDKTQVRFWAGWSNRLNALAAEITKSQLIPG